MFYSKLRYFTAVYCFHLTPPLHPQLLLLLLLLLPPPPPPPSCHVVPESTFHFHFQSTQCVTDVPLLEKVEGLQSHLTMLLLLLLLLLPMMAVITVTVMVMVMMRAMADECSSSGQRFRWLMTCEV